MQDFEYNEWKLDLLVNRGLKECGKRLLWKAFEHR